MIRRVYDRALWEIANIGPIRTWVNLRSVGTWLKNGKHGATPYMMKQANLLRLSRMFSVPTLVETGTCRADMLWALKSDFKKLVSIELSEELYLYSKRRCAAFSNIQIRHGDSAREIANLYGSITGRVIFWLDGHYSGGDTALGDEVSPVVKELSLISDFPNIEPIVVIDDARLFKSGTGYPSLESVFERLSYWQQPMNVSVHDDAIVAIPQYLAKQSLS